MSEEPIRSFDLFDTLLGRLHYSPHSVFALVEKNFPFPGFAFYRIAAECKADGTWPDIYRQFQQLTDIADEQASALMQFELETELSQAFPIVENRNLVKDGDLIISDTFYDKEQVKKLLEKIGLNQKVHIYASPYGKSSGGIWNAIKQQHRVACHLGDSLYSDIITARFHGIKASHYSNSRLSSAEQTLIKMGQSELACLMRTLRLQNPYPPLSAEYLLWYDQCQFNVPLLIQASLYLNDFCQKHRKKRILFSSRDGCLWIQIFQALYPQYESLYFHASRHTYESPTLSYIEYVQNIHTDDTLIVDAHGRGYSCEKFFKKHLKIQPTYLSIHNTGRRNHAILRRRKLGRAIEQINSDVCGTLYDVQEGQPLRCEPEYDLRFIRPMHACVEKCTEIIPHFTLQTFDQRVVEWAFKSMKSGLVLEKYVYHACFHYHFFNGDAMLHIHT